MLSTFTLDQVAEQSTDKSGLIVIEGKVYNITDYMAKHPGGDDILAEVLGQDATEAFHEVGHSKGAQAQLEALLVGVLKIEPKTQTKPDSRGWILLVPYWKGIVEVAMLFLLSSVAVIFFQVKASSSAQR
ncbi:cytochrome b5 [Colletotrichum karsti]|uniref:Cytochrome b5 n=1 Tax=Colletotrichum karsti TaxID=1095194 RepID=A0A9P6I1A0_9PEZI|nr:cytochrome b5 [Colletotrichum karsti]KAF9873967.1 cytochrome b5 [Colletotrichum karsti]